VTVDERLERLTERHEALTQTVKLMIHEQRETRQQQLEWQEKNQILIAQVLESIESLARIAHVHERRIPDLERGRS
jgi:hypothetical protein